MQLFLSGRGRQVVTGAFALLMGTTLAMPSFAQDGGPEGDRRQRWQQGGERPERGERGERGGPGGWAERLQNMDPEQRAQIAQRMQERMNEATERDLQRQKNNLGFSDEEFEVVKPLLARVQRLVTEASMSGMPGMGGRGGFMAGAGDMFRGLATEEGQKVMDATTKLRELVAQPTPGEEALKGAITQVRTARQAHALALKNAREELRSVLTGKQEAELILSGLLD